MKTYYKVSFEYSEGIYCTNMAHAENAADVEKHYSKYTWCSVREAAPYELDEAKAKGMPIIEIENEEPATEEPTQTESKEEESTMKTPYNTPIEKSTVNPMCADCTRFGKDCEGTSCQTWPGCVYKRRTDAEKTICKPKLIYQPDAPEDAHYNVQLWHSYDGGKTFHYAGYGRFFKDLCEAEAWRKQHRKNLSYDLMFGRLGNGTTVYNRAREERGDYPAIAHIDDCGAVRWCVDTKKLPPYVLEDVNAAALRDMAEFKEKFLKLTPPEALRAVYDTFPMNTIRNDISKETTRTLYEIYTEFMAKHGYTMPEQ